MATILLDEWSEEKCLQMIREYRKRPILWDKENPLFFKNTLKPMAWKEIGDALNMLPDQCKYKMNILMSSFRREKCKIRNSLKHLTSDNGTDSPQPFKSIWFAFDEMSFLLDKDFERKRQLNTDSDETDEKDGGVFTVNLSPPHHLDSPVRAMKRARSMISGENEYGTAEVQKERTESEVVQRQPIPGPSQTSLERDEEIKSFITFIGNKMKTYSDTTKNAVQQAICDIIFKADQTHHEKNYYERFTFIDDEVDPLNKQIFKDDDTIIKVQNDSDSD